MKKSILILAFLVPLLAAAQQDKNQKDVYVERENMKAFLENDLDKYVVYDLMSDGSKIFKDTLDFNAYRDQAIFAITQNQTILNRQLWATITLLTVAIGLLIFLIRKK